MATRSSTFFQSYHPIVWWVIGGTILTRITNFMVLPFMALYMGAHTHATPSIIGFVMGCAAMTSMLFSLVGGSLSDKFGRKQMMLLAMGLTVVDMVGYANARSIVAFLLLSILSGLCQSMFQPAASALLADVTDVKKRGSVYAMQYWAINVAAAVGPIIGAYFGTVATGWTFYLTAASSLGYFFVILIAFPNQAQSEAKNSRLSMRQTVRVIGVDKALLMFLIAGFACSVGYSQIDTNLPQQMAHTTSSLSAAKLFGFVLASNAIEVVFLQFPITRLLKRFSTVTVMMIGQAIFAIGYVAMGLASTPLGYFVSMFIITIGEIIVFPQNKRYIADLADDSLRGAYFGASSMTSFGLFLGPWVGGAVLSHFGGLTLFVAVGFIVAAGVPFYRLSGKAHLQASSSRENTHFESANL